MRFRLLPGRCIATLAALALTALLVEPLPAEGDASLEARRLNLYRPAAGEELSVVYRRDGEYDREALGRLNRLLRDTRTGEVGEIDRRLLDLLYDLAVLAKNRDGVFEVLQAYESPRTLDPLRRDTRVRKLDDHQRGRALHVRLRGTELGQLRDAAIRLGRGGVGYYPDENYLHLDIGRAHSW